MPDAGVPTYDELVLVAKEQTVRDRGPLLRRFVQALQAGALAVKADASVGVNPLLAANKDLERPLQLASVRATMRAFFPADAKDPYGWQDPDEWRAYGEWMKANGLLDNPPNSAASRTSSSPAKGCSPSSPRRTRRRPAE